METKLPVSEAIAAARQSRCRKSKRGVVLFPTSFLRDEIFTGFNHPPGSFRCTEECLRDGRCGKSAIHAEMAALREYQDTRTSLLLQHMEGLHVKVDEAGELMTSGGPSCVDCSKHLFDGGLSAFWLYHTSGQGIGRDRAVTVRPYPGVFARYSIRKFHELSLRAHGLPVLL